MAYPEAGRQERAEGKENALSIVEMENDAANVKKGLNQRRYTWPWLVLAAVLLAIALSIVWMRHEVKRIEQSRDLNAAPPERLK